MGDSDTSPREHVAGLAGLVAVALNIAAVVLLQSVPHSYKPQGVTEWLSELTASPSAAVWSSWAFTIGLAAMIPFAAGLSRIVKSPLSTTGAILISIGAILNAVGTLAPIAAIRVSPIVAPAMLQFTLLLDSAFNFFLGAGMIVFSIAARHSFPKVLTVIGVLGGLACLPVTLEFVSDSFANLLAVAGPIWLVWVTWASIRLMKRP